jgi:uncharacterized protein YprB with RNaseH-like and TPR domain
MRVIAYDLECSSLSGMIGRILCSGFKEILPPELKLNTKPYVFRGDDPKYKNSKDLADDSKLAVAIRDELEKYDIIVGHNCKLFDKKFLNARLAHAGERGLESKWTVDTMWLVRTHLRTSSKLDNVQKFLGLEDEKTAISWDDWQRAVGGDKRAFDVIVKHNIQDVLVLEQAYWKLLPFARTITRA